MADPVLLLRDFGVAFGEQIVLSRVNLNIPARGAVMLMGPGGAGKSTLVRTLAGLNEAQPALRIWGIAKFDGVDIESSGPRPMLVTQKARLLMASVLENLVCELPNRHQLDRLELIDKARELLRSADLGQLNGHLHDDVITLPVGVHRQLAILGLAAAEPKLLFVDEPTNGLNDEDAAAVLALLRRQATERGIVMITHNQRHARELGGETALVAGGRIIEVKPTEEFFTNPQTAAAQEYVRTGYCSVAGPNSSVDELDGEAEPPPPAPAEALRSRTGGADGPRGFRWLKRNELGGTPRPGIVDDMDRDLDALRLVGVTKLVTLEMERFDPDVLSRYEMGSIFFPMEDMHAPPVGDAARFCAHVAEEIAAGEVLAIHCRAGLGRTGTMLAAQLIWEGESAHAALEKVRRIEPRWVQSEAQLQFLREFAEFMARRRRDAALSVNTKNTESQRA